MSRCPNFPRCRFCPYLAWSEEESDFICINPEYFEEGGSSNEEVGDGTVDS